MLVAELVRGIVNIAELAIPYRYIGTLPTFGEVVISPDMEC
jgi:hypothetical protein